MNWSTEDHRHQQQNYYNIFQVVQHQNGIQQATAAVPPPQPTPPPPPPHQQQQQQLQQQQHNHQNHHHHHHPHNHHHQQQQQHQQQQRQQYQHRHEHQHSLPRSGQQMPTQFPTNHQLQQSSQHHQQWTTNPILTAPPSFFQQYPATVPSSTQYCAAPTQFLYSQRVTQSSVVSAASQQRPCLAHMYHPMAPQAPAALRQNVMSQPPATLITPTTTTSAQPIQLQYFSAPPYCQPPLGPTTYGHMTTPILPEPFFPKHRKHALPIIDPDTKENIMEREFRVNDMAPATYSITATLSSSTLTDIKKSEIEKQEEEQHIPQMTTAIADNQLPDNDNNTIVKENRELIEEVQGVEVELEEQDTTDSSAPQLGVVDHVESNEDAKLSEVQVEESTIEHQDDNNDDHGQTQFISTTPTTTNTQIVYEVEDECISQDIPSTTAEENLSLMDAKKNGKDARKAAPKAIKPQEATSQSTPLKKSHNNQHKKGGKKNNRNRESQKKQKAEIINNNTNKISNQNQNTQERSVSETNNRLTGKSEERSCSNGSIKADEISSNADNEAIKSCADNFLDDNNAQSFDKFADTTQTSDPNEDNDQSSQIYDSPKLTKSEQISSDIFGVESADDNELLFLNSSVSGFEEDLCISPPQTETVELDKAKDIHFGDFSQENLTQELFEPIDNNDAQQANASDSDTPEGEKNINYTLQELKALADVPASNVMPSINPSLYEIIGKNSQSSNAASSSHMNHSQLQNHMFQKILYKDSLNYVNRRRHKRDMPSHQQFQQQPKMQQQQRPNMIRINLSLKEDIQLAKSENAWVPSGIQTFPHKSESDEEVLKSIRGILNKLTPENFEKLLQNASSFPLNGVERIYKVMLLIFEKTVSEPNFAPIYASFCKFLFPDKNENHSRFKVILIKRIQEEFENNVNNAKAKTAKLRPIIERLASATDPKQMAEIKAELDDQEYQFRRRAWGTVRFIGEMFKLGFLKTDRVCTCIKNLLDPQCEEKLEYMCKLLTTVGPQLEPVDKQQANNENPMIRQHLDTIFNRIRQLFDRKKSTGLKISSRVRFMLQDVLELRARSWDQQKSAAQPPMLHSREVSPAIIRGPVSQQQRVGNNNMSLSSGSGYDKRRQNNIDEHKKSNPTQIDSNKLLAVFNNNEKSNNINLGNQCLYMWQQQLGPQSIQQSNSHQSRTLVDNSKESTPTPQKELSTGECERLLKGFIVMIINDKPKSEWFSKWKEISSAHHATIIYYLLTEYLCLKNVKRTEIDALKRLFTKLMKENLLSRSSFNEGYQKFIEICEDVLMDVPKAWQFIYDFLGPMLHHKLIPFNMIWHTKWFDTLTGEKFLQSMIINLTSEFGANYMRSYWRSNSLRWEMFIAEHRITTFIGKNHFEFIANECTPPIFNHRSANELVIRIRSLVDEFDQNENLVIDFISTNVHIDCSFIRNLTMFLCDYTVIHCNTPNSSSNSNKKSKSKFKLRECIFRTKCIPLLKYCIDLKEEYELSCLDAIVDRCKQLNHSSADDLIYALLYELHGEIISVETFDKWHHQQQLGNDSKLLSILNEFSFKLGNNVNKLN